MPKEGEKRLLKKQLERSNKLALPGSALKWPQSFRKSVPDFSRVTYYKNIERQGRDYLMATNGNIKAIKLLVGAQDYGNNLHISWYLISDPGLFDLFTSSFTGKGKVEGSTWVPVITNIFMEEELSAYTTLVHHSVLEAIEALMANLGQDFSKVDRKSRGFMGIS